MFQDCLRLLPSCVRWSAVPPGFSAQQLCEELAAPPPCAHIAAPDDTAPEQNLGAGQEVDVTPETRAADLAVGARCRLGAASDVEVAAGTAVRVPLNGACYAACLCQAAPDAAPGEVADGGLGACVNMPCPTHSSHCNLGTAVIGESNPNVARLTRVLYFAVVVGTCVVRGITPPRTLVSSARQCRCGALAGGVQRCQWDSVILSRWRVWLGLVGHSRCTRRRTTVQGRANARSFRQ